MSPRLPIVPKTRGDCAAVPRPCPFNRCRYHLSDFSPRAAESCALDVADRGPNDLSEIAKVVGLTAQRVHQIEQLAIYRLQR